MWLIMQNSTHSASNTMYTLLHSQTYIKQLDFNSIWTKFTLFLSWQVFIKKCRKIRVQYHTFYWIEWYGPRKKKIFSVVFIHKLFMSCLVSFCWNQLSELAALKIKFPNFFARYLYLNLLRKKNVTYKKKKIECTLPRWKHNYCYRTTYFRFEKYIYIITECV